MRARNLLAGAALVSGTAAVCVTACSLALDESKIPGALSDGGGDEVNTADVDQGADASQGAYVHCTTDAPCKAPNACLTGRCDLARQVCVYDQCAGNPACTGASCDLKSLACSGPQKYGFHAAQVKLPPGAIGCNASAARCFAASFPFVFAGTASSGVLAYAVANPGATTPTAVPIDGLAFTPIELVASGPRVWFLGNKIVSGATFKLPIAYIDVPTDPTVSRLTANAAQLQTSSANVAGAFGADNGGLVIVLDDATVPVTRVDAPLVDGATLSFYPATIGAGAALVASSGARLVAYRHGGAGPKDLFQLVVGAGTVGEQVTTEQDIAPSLGGISPQSSFASGPEGAVVMTANVPAIDASAGSVRAVRVAWVLDDKSVTTFDPTSKLDYEVYGDGPASQISSVLGGAAEIGSARALVLAGVKGDGGLDTSVQVVQRAPTTALVADSRFVLPGDPGRYVVAGSGGFGYALVVDTPGSTPAASIHVFAPGCK